MKNICFVSNFHKTYFFEKISRDLKEYGYKIFWICFDSKFYNYLLKENIPENVLLLSKDIIGNDAKSIGDFKLNELVNGDRFLRHQKKWAYNYLKSIQLPTYNFINNNNIEFVFGEVTHAHEILIHRLVNHSTSLRCAYLHPQSVRIPNKRFFFLKDEFQSEIFKEELISNETWEEEYELIRPVRPRRVAQVDVEVKTQLSLKGKLSRLKRFFTQENIQKDLPSQIDNKFKRSGIAIKEEFNKITYNFVSKDDISILEDKKFVLYTLHMQPEASVDVVGVYFDDQLQNIKNIWRILPDDWHIVIKEHSNAIGNRTYRFFKEFKKLKNSIILHEKSDSHSIIDKAEAIFTVSGTIAYEASLKGKPAFTFADIFFNKLTNCMKISLNTLREIKNIQNLFEILQKENKYKLEIEDYSKYLYQRSFNGIVDAPVNSSDWYDEENTKTVSNEFNKFLKKFSAG